MMSPETSQEKALASRGKSAVRGRSQGPLGGSARNGQLISPRELMPCTAAWESMSGLLTQIGAAGSW